MTTFTLPFAPVPRGRHRIDFRRRHAYKCPKSQQFENMLLTYIKEHIDIDRCYEDALVVDIKFHITKPKSVKRQFPSVKPDLDNLAKSILDVMERAEIYRNDSQIINLSLKKEYSDKPKIEVALTEVQE